MNYFRIILAFVAVLAMTACSGGADRRGDNTLVVSIEPQRRMLQEIAGDSFDIVTLIPTGANPETFEPTMTQRRALNEAAAFFPIGYLPFEHRIIDGASIPVVDTAAGIEPITGTHSHGHSHDVDPHLWLSVRNARQMAENMTHALTELYPDSAEAFRARCRAITERLDSLDSSIGRRLAAAGAPAFAVWHPSLSYFARDYGLNQISISQDSKEVSISALRSIIDRARADSVSVFFFQRELDSRQAENINAEIGSRLIAINPMQHDWEGLLDSITEELIR